MPFVAVLCVHVILLLVLYVMGGMPSGISNFKLDHGEKITVIFMRFQYCCIRKCEHKIFLHFECC